MRYSELMEQKTRDPEHIWGVVTSAMTATILPLMQLWVVPASATTWFRYEDKNDTTSTIIIIIMSMKCPVGREAHVRWVEERPTQEMWQNVTPHEANSGLRHGEGPLFGPTLRIHHSMLANGNVQEAMAVQAAVAHNIWGAVRANKDPALHMCPRCGLFPETLLHRLWTCENNCECTHEDLVRTQDLRTRALEGCSGSVAF